MVGFTFGICIMLVAIFSKYINVAVKGMSYIASNTKDFTYVNGNTIDGKYSITIDLNNLDSNIGKELYNDGENIIYVNLVDNTGNINTGGYRIHFRSSGKYSLDHAELISGVIHSYAENDLYDQKIYAKMTAEYNNKIYKCNEMGTTGVSYKDGDGFSFYIFPDEAYKNNEISLNETGIVKITATDLYKNIWLKN